MATVERDRAAVRDDRGILHPLSRPGDAVRLALAGLVIVVAFGLVLAKTTVVTRGELDVDRAFSLVHAAPLTSVALAINWLFSPLQAVILTIVIAGIVVWRTVRLVPAAVFATVVALGWLSSAVLKAVVHRARPDVHALAHPFLPTPLDFSYPSGHTVFATSLAVGLFLLARGTHWRRWALVLGIACAVLVALSRVYLGVHYPSDVLASLIWAPCVAALVIVVIHRAGSWNPRLERGR
ncbi:phosphatase PAP2 family protein [Frondihabitans sucicola]|uniref:Phosphatase PAP2 family protein n=1 Tax=Frondihabitans sucicola TaxID=1268041 RepID=A0ABM8GS80_9MICO|nr:phosphatase PAP2 family protein [Frondihabitans sucicola]BDZ51130.1 phosphatase PAP2 family protein [Frondihabitans sucicola]